jgi:long-subunit acyl-CoA synthetase (AMP-forming)
MVAAGAQNPPLKKKIAAWARKVGLEGGYAEQQGEGKPMFFGLANKLVFSKVREKLGLDRCRMAITSAAPIAKSTLEFFLSLGLPIYEVYGMSECSGPATISLPHRYRTGSAGFCIPGAELKIAEDGEVCMRGRHVFKGYYKSEAITAETIDEEGWLHSGDIGTLDEGGFLRITDRKKDLIITAGGENIAPQLIEGQLKAIPVVAQAVVIGDRRKYLAALFTLDPEKILAEAQACGSAATDVESASSCETFHAHLQAQVEEINKTLARVQTIKRFVTIPSEFTIEGGELTPTMKVKRKVIREKYAAQIEGLYPSS